MTQKVFDKEARKSLSASLVIDRDCSGATETEVVAYRDLICCLDDTLTYNLSVLIRHCEHEAYQYIVTAKTETDRQSFFILQSRMKTYAIYKSTAMFLRRFAQQ